MVSIQEIYPNIKRFLTEGDTVIAVIIVTVGVTSFWLGRQSTGSYTQDSQNRQGNDVIQAVSRETKESNLQNAPPISGFLDSTESRETDPQVTTANAEGTYVASKNGTKYHLPWCGSAKQIKEENKIWFKTKAEAEGAGYTPAANCKGI